MFKSIAVLLMVVVCASAKASPGLIAPLAYASPVLAHSSQVISRTYNGVVHPVPLAYAAHPLHAPLAYSAPLIKSVAVPLAYHTPIATSYSYINRHHSGLAYASPYGYARYAAHPAAYISGHHY